MFVIFLSLFKSKVNLKTNGLNCIPKFEIACDNFGNCAQLKIGLFVLLFLNFLSLNGNVIIA